MNVDTALIKRVADEPDAFAPRIVLADWLMSHHDRRDARYKWGELIGAQILRADRPGDVELWRRERDLREFMLAQIPHGVDWRRGFATTLALGNVSQSKVNAALAMRVGDPRLTLVHRMRVSGPRVTPAAHTILDGPFKGRIHELEIGYAGRSTRSGSRWRFPELRGLCLRGRAAIADLASLPLVSLAFVEHELVPARLAEVVAGPWQLHRFVLDLRRSGPPLQDALRPVLAGDAFPGLRSLAVAGPIDPDEVVAAISASGRLGVLDELGLDFSQLQRFDELARHPRLRLIPLGRTAEAHLALARALDRRLGRPQDAVERYFAALELTGHDDNIHAELAAVKARLPDPS